MCYPHSKSAAHTVTVLQIGVFFPSMAVSHFLARLHCKLYKCEAEAECGWHGPSILAVGMQKEIKIGKSL